MKNFLLVIFLLLGIDSYSQSSPGLKLRDTTVLLAKEYCKGQMTSCLFGDNIVLNHMIFYDGISFWRNYKRQILYFYGLELRNLQEKNSITDYEDKVKDFFKNDISNDRNLIEVVYKNSKRQNADTVLYKIYRAKLRYSFVEERPEYVPNFFDCKNRASHIWRKVPVYFIMSIEAIAEYNDLSCRKIFVNCHP